MTLGYTRSDMLLGLKSQGHRVNKSILQNRDKLMTIHRHSLGSLTSRIELFECLLVLSVFKDKRSNPSVTWCSHDLWLRDPGFSNANANGFFLRLLQLKLVVGLTICIVLCHACLKLFTLSDWRSQHPLSLCPRNKPCFATFSSYFFSLAVNSTHLFE